MKEITRPYHAGYDCGLNGANEINSHFKWFATPDMTQEWESGKREGDAMRLKMTVPQSSDDFWEGTPEQDFEI